MKTEQNSQNKLSKQEKEFLSNKTVLLSSFAILYALLLLFFKRMCSYSGTVYGAVTFMEYLMWASLGGAMLFAAWSAYKEKKRYYLYSGMCLFVFLSILLVLRVNSLPDNRAYLICFIALAMTVILSHVYYILRANNKFTGRYQLSFLAVLFITITVLVIAVLEPRVWDLAKTILG